MQEVIIVTQFKCSRVKCENMEKTKGEFKLCSACRTVRYCCVECQRMDWPEHKQICNKSDEIQDLNAFLNSKNGNEIGGTYSQHFCMIAMMFFAKNAKEKDEPIIFAKINRRTRDLTLSIDPEDIKLIRENSTKDQKDFFRRSIKTNFLVVYFYDVHNNTFSVYKFGKPNIENIPGKTKTMTKTYKY